jgi:hypothetical protein
LDEDKGETGIDCGGPCPPCEHAPKQKSFETPTTNLPTDVYAIEKITAGNASVKVLSGQNVTFHTAGTIELLPGFEVEEGGNFTAEPKGSILEVTADCNEYCEPTFPYNNYLRFANQHYEVDVANVEKIYYEVWRWDPGEFLFHDTKYITQEGRVELWDLLTGERKSYLKSGYWCKYVIAMWIYPCQSNYVFSYAKAFTVHNSSHWKSQTSSMDLESEELEVPPSLSPNIENIIPQNIKAPPAFSILPNPNPGTFQLETNFPLSDIGNLKIVNLLGIPVFETQTLSSNTIQLQNAATGQYFVVMILKDGSVLTQKMMVN